MASPQLQLQVLALLLLLATTATATATPTPTLIFLLGGQSNMGGRGGATNGPWDGVVPPDSGGRKRGSPFHAGIDVHNVLGVGPGMSFAHALFRAIPPSTVIGLVPCAQGGTPIANWTRGTELYERMVGRGRAAMATAGAGAGARMGALLWYQGEADTIRREDAEVYARKMEGMVRDVRRDLALPELLVIQVGIATGQGKFVEPVREAQKAVRLPFLKYVDAKGLPIANDYTHLTTPAQVKLGKLLAKAYLSTL
ncbi:hypothetical protein OsJ_13439 [Oryza sativa Japonica Group]|uniref:Sialate O-acetylesterase domain-containing protein n=1 Tax=Oryza sativa subsp. japonica TaxID=39947 RepID=A3APY0_ORYSJ|nr:hypothetical protein OsJ_13439 [Oryza sativa Japonica Group]